MFSTTTIILIPVFIFLLIGGVWFRNRRNRNKNRD